MVHATEQTLDVMIVSQGPHITHLSDLGECALNEPYLYATFGCA
jgi:hypothetical protein